MRVLPRLLASFTLDQARSTLRIGLPALPRLIAASRLCTNVKLSPHAGVDVFEPPGNNCNGEPVVVYVHGGAWGQGASWNFATIGEGLSRTYAQCPVLVLSYALYPDALMKDQVHSVVLALEYARREYPERKLVCIAQSSGAHISSLAFLSESRRGEESTSKSFVRPLADVFIAQAGVYNVSKHFLFEASRCLAYVSPMMPASAGSTEPNGDTFDEVSPIAKVAALGPNTILTCNTLVSRSIALEGDGPAQSIVGLVNRSLQATIGNQVDSTHVMPQVFVQAAVADLTVPTTSNSIPFYEALSGNGLSNSRLLLYEDQMDHADFVTDWLQGPGLVRREAQRFFFDVGQEPKERRSMAKHAYGEAARTIDTLSPEEIARGLPAAHIRDLCRILKGARYEDSPYRVM